MSIIARKSGITTEVDYSLTCGLHPVEAAQGGEHALGGPVTFPEIFDDLEILVMARFLDANKHGLLQRI